MFISERKSAYALVALLATTFLVVVCAANVEPAAKFRGEIQYLLSAVPAQVEALKPVFEKLEEETGIRVKIVMSDYGSYQPKLLMMVAGGSAPELVGLGTEFANMAAQGALQPLDEYIEKDKDFNIGAYDKGMVQAMRLWGRTWHIPCSASTAVLRYNKDLFDKAGLAYPTHDWDNFDWNWGAFVAAAKKLTRIGGQGEANQWGIGGLQIWWLWPWYWGGDWVSEDLKRYTGNSPETVKAIQEIANLEHVHRVRLDQPFGNGRVGMEIAGIWGLQEMSQEDVNWDFAARPVGTHHSVVNYVDGFGMGKGCKRPDLAWEAIKWLTSKEHLLDYIMAYYGGGSIPARIDVRERWVKTIQQKFARRPLDFNVLVRAFKYAQPVRMRYLTNWKEIDSTLWNVIAPVLSGRKSAEIALNEVQGKMQLLVDAGSKIPKF